MSEISIRAVGLGKEYVLGGAEEQHDSFREMLSNSLLSPFKKIKKLRGDVEKKDRFWALKDVNFEIQQGDIVGVVGHNGAGKSTLLKVLSRITTPTTGKVEVYGRVASLLEVGTGFHPELTGRENIYLNGAILGMKRSQIERQFDAIVDFSGVEKFIDTPVKRYSSGMYVRLAFSVAAHLETDVLLVDEVLSVGDADFRKRCIGRMSEVSQQGRTVIFVSHNLGIIQELCNYSIYLKHGSVEEYGLTSNVLQKYLKDGATNQYKWIADKNATVLRELTLCDIEFNPVSAIDYDQPAFVEIKFMPDRDDNDFVIAIRITDELGSVILTSWDTDSYTRKTKFGALERLICNMPTQLLKPGSYYVSVMVRKLKHGYLESVEEVTLSFEVTNVGFGFNLNRFGAVLPVLTWSS